jgi:hypothetical protein
MTRIIQSSWPRLTGLSTRVIRIWEQGFMKCARNMDGKGRLVRGLMGLALLVGVAFGFGQSAWRGIPLAGAGLFGLFEAVCGWCFARACGMKTRL